MKYNIVAISFFSLILFSCNQSSETINQKDNIREFKALYTTHEDLKHEKLSLETNKLNYIFSMLSYKDYLILSNPSKEYLFTVIHIPTNQIIGYFGKIGDGPNEFRFPTSLQLVPNDENKLGLYQRQKFKYVEMDLEKWINEKKEEFSNESSTFDTNFQNVIFFSPNRFLGYGIFDKRYALADKSGKVQKQLHEYAFISEHKTVSKQEMAMAYQLKILVNNKANYMLAVASVSPSVEFTKITPDTIIIERSYHLQAANFKSTQGSQISATMTEENTWGFVSITANDDLVYLLYSGKKYIQDKEAAISAKDIFVFDWKGNPVKHYVLDTKVNCIAINEQGNKLYAFLNEKEPKIISYTLD